MRWRSREARHCVIANEWDLAIPGFGVGTVVSNGNGNSNGNGRNTSEEELGSELVTQRKRQQENLKIMDRIMGL